MVEKLVDGELMKRVSDKVYTDFIIYKEKDRTANLELEKELSDKLYKSIWSVLEQGLNELREQKFYIAQEVSKQIKLESFLAVRTIQNAVHKVRDEACGGIQPYDEYPDRPNGGKWYAMGSHYPGGYDYSKNTYQKYYISGEAVNALDDYCGLKRITLCEYDCELGKTHSGYNNRVNMKYSMNGLDVMKMIYAIYSGQEEDLPIINLHCFDNVRGLEKLNFLKKDESAKIIVDIPVISMSDKWKIYEISNKYSKSISDKFHDDLMILMKNSVKVPSHLKSVPEWQKYMNCCSTFPMLVILKAKDEGLFLKEYNLDEYPVPAIFIAIDE